MLSVMTMFKDRQTWRKSEGNKHIGLVEFVYLAIFSFPSSMSPQLAPLLETCSSREMRGMGTVRPGGAGIVSHM